MSSDWTVPRLTPTTAAPASVGSGAPPSFLADRYEDIQFLGEGGMGIVYRALDPRLGRLVAIKLLKAGDPASGGRFIAEARAQAQVVHDNVCRVYDTGETDGHPFIVMQYIDGRPLSEIADLLSLEQQVRVMQQIAMAVHEAHRLGIIHRDIKPANILLEKRDGGGHKPYILDFGLARQVGERGQTQTGVVVGTLSYMPPEQAQGDWRAMDRRSDVFSLGATLYDLIAGKPPFFDEQPMRLLFKVSYEDAPRLRAVKRGAPAALETIVMKCVEREPSRRYESARALAEDLQRFLDGDSIVAKPPSLARVIEKKARRHKVATALLGAVLAGALALVGVSLHADRRAEEQARIARDIGASVKEMELFLRAAYAMPPHDVERERGVVRAKLAELEGRMTEAGEAAEGPGQYALGKGHLALGDPERALPHLRRAIAAGYSAPEVHYALGEALGELFRRALADTRRITNAEERKQRVAELERELRDPALSHLRAAAGAKIEVPAHAEGLIALYEGRNEAAVAKAKEAFEEAPWMYEAKRLEGDALFAEGSKYRHDAAFDHDRMKPYFEAAERAYSIAADLGRSDPAVHLARCDLWEKAGWAAYNKGISFDAPFDAADAACARALQNSPRDERALVQRALVLNGRVYLYTNTAAVSEPMLDLAEEALDLAEEAVAARPEDVMAQYAAAQALSLRVRVLQGLGEETSMDAAVGAYERVLSLDPRFTWALNELGNALVFDATREEERGRDGSALFEAAIRQFERTTAVDPTFALPVGGRLRALVALIEARIERGQDAGEHLTVLLSAADGLETASFGPWLAAFWRARARRLAADHDLARGEDPRPRAAAALEIIRAFAGDSPKDDWLLAEIARCRLLEATHALRAGLDPAPALALARTAALAAFEQDTESALLLSRIEIIAARAAAGGPEVWDAALARLDPLVSGGGRDPVPLALAAEVFARRAGALVKAGQSPGEDVRRGLAMADAALAWNPAMGRAWLAKGYLHLTQARAARTEEARSAAGRLAGEAFDAAVRRNPLLARERGAVPEDIRRSRR